MAYSSPKKDERREVGAVVQAKARAVTSPSECKRLYGTNWKSQTVTGTVLRLVKPPPGTRRQASIVAEWQFESGTKIKEVKLVNVTLVTASATQSSVENLDNITQAPSGIDERRGPEPSQLSLETSHAGEERTTALRAPNLPSSAIVTTAHGAAWTAADIRLPLNGTVRRKHWSVSCVTGQQVSEGCGVADMSPYDYFLWMFPMSHLPAIVSLTNEQLARHAKPATNASEILRFFGVLVLMSRYEFGPRRELWMTSSANKYIPAPNFTRIMPNHRFELLRTNVRFSSSTAYADMENCNRWSLVDDFVAAINMHREEFVSPSDFICVDESMSRWYGLGGDWIDVGLPTYRAIDRKPENGCEIKASACGRSGIMLRLEIVKSPVDDVRSDEDAGLPHGTAVTYRLVSPWAHSSRIVCADSYFASVRTAKFLYEKGLRFIGVIKTAHREFPLSYLGAVPMSGRGTWKSLIHTDEAKAIDVGALLWVDRERRYFVTTAGTTLPGNTIYRERWSRVDNESRLITTETAIPNVAELYYQAASQIDRHNRCRQDDLRLEKKFRVREWSTRVNTSLLAICIVDAWLLYKGNRGSRYSMSPNEFYSTLAEQLIDNTYMAPSTRSTAAQTVVNDVTKSGIGPHLTSTSRKRKREDGTVTNALYQGKCRVCHQNRKTKWICSECTRTQSTDYWVCHCATGRDCFAKHLSEVHIEY